ncbi:hypothetical protein PHLCEN_2v7484 [Hermanssonia centrifuga]|uniref:Uncharacterized protein n=1 Tax=Hermanssonia centrifuga TaxID=98765 RepID=A0A2R6NWN4_9APHY|nr:hypothetical protein PHLCEN_2v7484 [Hermanssonia centrifuga]
MSSQGRNELKSSSSSTAESDEKPRSVRVERADDVAKVKPKIFNEHINVSGINERKLMRKLDWWLVPWLSFLYLLSFLDRTSIGNAKVSGAFGGLLAAAISNMGGIGGKPAWAWIFILEGLITVLAGIASFWIIQDFPDTAKFLTEEERTFVIRRLQEDDQFSAAGEKLKLRYIWQSLLDWKTWIASEYWNTLISLV